jgi:hypothetical protein
MRTWSYLLLLALAAPAFAAEVYRTVDEQGNAVFSDKPIPGGQRLDVPPAAAVKLAPPRPLLPEKAETPAPLKPAAEEALDYRVRIVQPRPDEAVRNNAGEVAIRVEVEPRLAVARGHRFEATLDGKPQPGQWYENSFSLTNVDRGTHTLQVTIVDTLSLRVLARSEPVVFHLLRHSVLFR